MSLSRICAALLIAASPLMAADTKPHAAAPTAKETLGGGVPRPRATPRVRGGIFHGGCFSPTGNGPAADGKYSLSLPGGRPTTLIVEDFAYEPVSQSIVPTNDAALDLRLTTSRPTVTVTLKNGEKHVLDLGTSQFGYLIVFSGYGRTDTANFCKPDGSQFLRDKNEIRKIIGPATLADSPACCTRGQVMAEPGAIKTGGPTQGFFNYR